MLELKSIKKDYPVGGGTVHALKGIDLRFRKSEFVSILGPSGCGKTTMLNIIGGLDHYTEGDLIIGGRSTKSYKDRDWDTYRNHSIGFVFQTYNLIPHQSVLQNVELALTLSGVPKGERRRRAKEALEKVGLGDQLRKKPSEMSGGQMQRVAIARAIVNNPEIILADEPTGALDTETSVQVMEILKEIAQDRLVIMVTHNPELAEKYSTRIVRMLDGVITDDSSPVTDAEKADEMPETAKAEKIVKKPKQTKKKSSMSLITACGLSLKNLFTKKGRTFLTSFAGSIGIIGIALIFAVSQGTTNYIDSVQEETLASYPLTIETKHIDLGELLQTFIDSADEKSDHKNDAVYSSTAVYKMFNSLNSLEAKTNDLAAFKTYLEEKRAEKGSKFNEAVTGVQYSYGLDLMVYTKAANGRYHRADTVDLMNNIMKEFGMTTASSNSDSTSSSGMSMFSMGQSSSVTSSAWQEMLSGDGGEVINPLLKKQYDVINKGGHWPEKYNEIALVVDENNELDDMTLYALGLKSEEEISEMLTAAMTGAQVDTTSDKWSYDEICAMEFRVVPNGDCYRVTTGKDGKQQVTQYGTTNEECAELYEAGIPLKVTAILRQSDDAISGMLKSKGSIAYTTLLTEKLIERAAESQAVAEQQKNPETDIFTGLPFKLDENTTVEQKSEAFMICFNGLTDDEKIEVYKSIAEMTGMQGIMSQALVQRGSSQEEAQAAAGQMTLTELKAALSKALGAEFTATMEQLTQRFDKTDRATLLAELQVVLSGKTDEELAAWYDAEMLTFSSSTFNDNLIKLGKIDLANPVSINLFTATFEDKELMEEGIAEYNERFDNDTQKISYTDYIGLLMSSVTTVIKAITYVLIAFVAVSLIVSSIMIGVITLISVQERTKEIGILRAIGASKRNVSSMFNAETVIIGFASGLFGVVITYLLCIPINLILHHLTKLDNLSATLPIPVALILIIISMLLTLIAGIIPSRSAAKKDPVVALRTE